MIVHDSTSTCHGQHYDDKGVDQKYGQWMNQFCLIILKVTSSPLNKGYLHDNGDINNLKGTNYIKSHQQGF